MTTQDQQVSVSKVGTMSANPKESKAQFIWTSVIITFFAIQAVIWAIAIWLTSSDRSHAIVPQFDESPTAWNDRRSAQADSDRLGWTVSMSSESVGDIYRSANIHLTAKDSNDEPIENANLNVTAFHLGVASEQIPVQFLDQGNGNYVAKVRVHKDGIWQFHGDIIKGTDRYLLEQRIRVKVGDR